MEKIAFYFYNLEISWRTIIIALGIIAAYLLMIGLVHGGPSRKQVSISLPFAIVFSVVMARLVHYYCNSEQYGNLKNALTDYSAGNFSFTGAVVGCLMAIGLTKLIYRKSSFLLLSAVYSLGICVALAVARISLIYTNDCRGKLVITNEKFFGLPFSTEVILETGSIGYYLALFLINAVLVAFVFGISLCFWFYVNKHTEDKKKYAFSALFTLSLLSAIEIITDSIRYDKSFFRSNGFVSHGEIFYAVILLASFVIINVCLVKTKGFKVRQIFLWLGFLVLLGGAGALEYFVQRHGDLFFPLYGGMFVCLVGAAVMNTCLLKHIAKKRFTEKTETSESKVVVLTEEKTETPESKVVVLTEEKTEEPKTPEKTEKKDE